MPKTTKTKEKKVKPDFLVQSARYLESIGWKVLVVGGIKIRQRPPLKYNYTLEIDFTGSPLPKKITKKKS